MKRSSAIVIFLSTMVLGCSISCGGSSPSTNDGSDTNDGANGDSDANDIVIPKSCKGGVVTYGVGGNHFRTTLGDTVATENISEGLDALSDGGDEWISSSPDGEWLLLETTRFDSECSGWNCLALVKGDLSSGEAVKINGNLLHGDDYGAVASSGTRIVYPFGDGPNEKDLFAINKAGSTWGAPILLTVESKFPFNLQPSISDDGSKVVFDCGNDPYGQPPTSICEVNTDGTNFRVVWTPEQGATGVNGRANVALHHPGYFSDGSIVFEADWSGEQIWRLSGDGPPVVISGQYSNDNSPCVLDNQCIVSVWLERPGSSGTHELKVMDAAGGNFSMLRTDIDIIDTGTSCSR